MYNLYYMYALYYNKGKSRMPVSIRLPDDLDRRLEFLARQTGRTKTFYIMKALVERIDDLEDYYLAADVLERIREGKESSYSSAEVRKDLGLDD
jgi:RHH-type transcriptional regulator, rel operon repressor / antitoxin RelB